jgi:hypothetical protein
MKAKKIIITAAFALLMLGLKAQDNYEYATVSYFGKLGSGSNGTLGITYEGKYNESEIKVDQGNPATNLAPVLQVVHKMTNEGWKIYKSNEMATTDLYNYYFLLRKKKS